ncbi:MAG: DinB family protein, partial [Chloroflexota bacterium]|nr:DinB family protein [Chloroflexota bacterium]
MLYPPDPDHVPDPPPDAGEVATLLGYLERQRATFAWKVGGLDAAGLRTTLAPSEITLGGMLKHLARFEDDMSTEWLHGEAQLAPWNAVDWDAEPAWDWRTAADDAPEELYTRWRKAVIRARTRFAEALAQGGPDRHATRQTPNLRYIVLNMIEEYA